MESSMPNIFLITVEALRFDFMPSERVLSLIPRRYINNMYYGPCVAAGPYTWASIPSIFTALQPQIHNFGQNISEPTLIDVLRGLGYRTLTVKPSEATTFLLYSIYTKFDKIINVRYHGKNTNLSKNEYLFYKRFVRKTRELLKKIPQYESLALNRFHYLFSYVENILYKISYGLRLAPQCLQNLYFNDSRHIYTAALHELRSVAKPVFMWIHVLDTHEPYTYDAIQKFGIDNYIELMMRILFHQIRTYVRILRMLRFNLSIKNVLESIASELAEDPELKYVKKHLHNLYNLAIEYMCRKLSVFIHLLIEQYDNVFVILTSDHGEELFDHHSYGHLGILSPWGFIPVPYNELIMVPIVIMSTASTKISFKEEAMPMSHYAIPSFILRVLKEYLHDNKLLTRSLEVFKCRNSNAYLFIGSKSNNKVYCIPSESQAIVFSVVKKLGKGVSLKLTCINKNGIDSSSSCDILIHPFYGIRSSCTNISEDIISTLIKGYLLSTKKAYLHALTSKVKWRLKTLLV